MRIKGLIAIVALAFVFAAMGVFARLLQFDFTVLQQTYLRVGVAAVLALLFFLPTFRFPRLQTAPVRDWLILLFRATTQYAGVLAFTVAVIHTKLANASFLATLPLVPLFAYFFLRERLTRSIVFYTLLSAIGVGLIALKDLSLLSGWGFGESMALLSVVLFDLNYVTRRLQSDHFSNEESTVIMLFFGTIALVAAAIVMGDPIPVWSSVHLTTWVVVIAAAMFNVLNVWLTNYGFGHLKASVAGNVLTLESVFAILLGAILFSEFPSLRELLGGAVIIASVIGINSAKDTDTK